MVEMKGMIKEKPLLLFVAFYIFSPKKVKNKHFIQKRLDHMVLMTYD